MSFLFRKGEMFFKRRKKTIKQFRKIDISMSIIESLLIRPQDEKCHFHVTWDSRRIAA